MKKLFKKLFSRFPLVALVILLMLAIPFAAFVLGLIYAETIIGYFFPEAVPIVTSIITVLDWIIVAATVLHVANRNMVPETKIPWILCIAILNLFGVVIYVLFSSHRPSRKEAKRYHAIYAQIQGAVGEGVPMAQLKEEMGHWAAVSASLVASEPNAVVQSGTKTEYFPSGEEFLPALLEDLEHAEKFIFMEYFIIEYGKCWDPILEVLERKAKAGVEVRFMYDDVGSMGKVRFNYDKKLRERGIRCVKFSPFLPVVSAVHNNRDHRKITVIDGKVAYTGGLNLADEYINETHPFGYWKDNAIRMEGPGVKMFTILFLTQFDSQSKQVEDFSPYFPPEETVPSFEGSGYIQPYATGPVPLYQRHLGEDVYMNILNAAHDYVWITTPYLIIDYRMSQAIIMAAKRGVDVRVLTPHIPDKKLAFGLTRSNYMALIKGGVKVYEYTPGFVHAKTFLADDKVAVVGTVNLDYRSFLYHFEDAVLMYKTQAVAQIKQDLEETFAASALQTEEDAKKSVVWRLLCEIAKVFAPLF